MAYTPPTCISCKVSASTTQLYDIFDGIYYCQICAERYKLALPELDIDKIVEDWDIQ